VPAELNLRFPDPDHVVVSRGGEDSGTLPFASPLTAKDRQDLRWYLEVYGAHSLGDPDDGEARRIAVQLPIWGKRLFEAVFGERAAARIFNGFQDAEDGARLLTVSTEHPAILALPWELLHDPATGGVFLFNERPRISIRRRVAGAGGGRKPFKVQSKDRLHLLFVVSRPEGAGFLDPRADASAVLDALAEHAPGRCTWEFLRVPTLDALVARLDDEEKPPIDILHFDGHGVFDPHGGLPERMADRKVDLAQVLAGTLLKDTPATPATESPPNTGYLLFETPDQGPRPGLGREARHDPAPPPRAARHPLGLSERGPGPGRGTARQRGRAAHGRGYPRGPGHDPLGARADHPGALRQALRAARPAPGHRRGPRRRALPSPQPPGEI